MNPVVAAGSAELARWVTEAFQLSPWLRLGLRNEIRIDWDEVVTRMKQERTSPRRDVDLLPNFLGKLLPELPSDLFNATRNLARGGPEALHKTQVTSPFVLLSEDLRSLMRSFVTSLEPLCGALSAHLSKLRRRHSYFYGQDYEIERTLSLLQRISTRALAVGLESVKEIEIDFWPYFRMTADIVRRAYGVEDSFGFHREREEPFNYAFVCLSRRILKLKLEVFDLLANGSKMEEAWDETSFTVAEMGRLARLVRELRELGDAAPRGTGYWNGARRSRSSSKTTLWLTSGSAQKASRHEWRVERETLSSNPEEIFIEAILSDLPDWRALRRVLSEEGRADVIEPVTKSVIPLEALLTKIRGEREDHGLPLISELLTTVDWLIEKTPLVALFASGILATYPVSEIDGTKRAWGISLDPSLASSYVCQEALGSLPLSWLGGPEETENPPADKEEEKEEEEVVVVAPSSEEPGGKEDVSSGYLAWQNALRSAR